MWWILGGFAAVAIIGIGLIVMVIALASLGSNTNNSNSNANANIRNDNRNRGIFHKKAKPIFALAQSHINSFLVQCRAQTCRIKG